MPDTLEDVFGKGTEVDNDSGDVYVADDYLEIDNDLRIINIPYGLVLGVYNDDDTHRLKFIMPKMYGDIDLSTFSIRVNYTNADRETGIGIVTDAQPDGDRIKFSWLVGRPAYKKSGIVQFSVCLRDVDKANVVQREFNTTVASLAVLPGLEAQDELTDDEYLDIVNQLTRKVDELNKEALATINQKVDDVHKSANNAAESEENAKASAIRAESYATGGTDSREGEDADNAKYYAEQSGIKAEDASQSAKAANESENAAHESEANAAESAELAKQSANTSGWIRTFYDADDNLMMEKSDGISTSALSLRYDGDDNLEVVFN